MSIDTQVGGGRNDEFESAKSYAELNVTPEQPAEFPTKIEKSDIQSHPVKSGETEIVLQRHGAYIRDREDPNTGSLSPESAAVEKTAATAYFEAFLNQVPVEERSKIDVLVVASDTQYFNGGRRSYETATLAQQAAQEVFASRNLPAENIINTTGRLDGEGGPRTMPKLREPNMLNESPEFLDYMLDKYNGINLDFWVAFESDTEKEAREKMGAEGPDDIADRTAFTVRALARYGQMYHENHPDRRLIIWGATHYDTISPFVKRDVFGVSKDQQLLVDYGAGITIDVDSDGKAITELGGNQYEIPLTKRA